MRFCTATLGCKVNQYETQAMEGILISRGHSRSAAGDGNDVCIINTCAVTAESVRKSRQAVRRMKKLEPNALIAVCGCFSQLDAESVAALGVDIVGGSGDRYTFLLKLESLYMNSSKTIPPSRADKFEELPPISAASSEKTRALLKIQDGCDNYCAYCIIPYARGRSRSLPLDRVAEHARSIAEQGFREIIITGIEISSYGKDLEGTPSLTDALQTISKAAPKTRLRMGSLDPCVVTEEFCDKLLDIPNLCNHFHLSLQSGCDDTLKRMGRKYDTGLVKKAISNLRRLFPDCGITADLITGFPGETDAEFEQTLEFITDAAFSAMHIFPFSPRPGTRAADMPLQVEKSTRQNRARIATEAAKKMTLAFQENQIGKTVEVLFERKRGNCWIGHSGSYLEVAVRNGGAKNELFEVRITDMIDKMVIGKIV